MLITNYEEVKNCVLCGSGEKKIVDAAGHIVACGRCGLRFVSPRPAQGDIAENYDRSYQHCPGWGKLSAQMQLIYARRFNFMRQFIQEGKILDLGAGRGDFLFKAKQTNRWQCFGTETSRYAAEFAQKEFGLTLDIGQLEDLRYPPDSFDVVSFWHVLEHLPDPAKTIAETGRILKKDGFLFIAVPNDSWLGRRQFFKNAVKRKINRILPAGRKLKLKRMYPPVNEDGNKHLFYWTPRTLKRLLKKHNFKIKSHSVDFDYQQADERLERRYQWGRLLCHLTGINAGNAILIAARKER